MFDILYIDEFRLNCICISNSDYKLSFFPYCFVLSDFFWDMVEGLW